MEISTSGGSGVDEFKAIEIQLTFERAKSALTKVQGDNLLEEFVRLVNGEGAAVRHKRDDIGAACSLYFEKQAMQLFGKRFNDATVERAQDSTS